MSAKPVVIVLHGPSGVGKDSVIDELRERTGIHRPTSSADRKPRDGEVDGIHYHFLSNDEFKKEIADGRYLEWAGVYGELKGVRTEEVMVPLALGKDIIIRTDVNGARTWRRKFEGATFVILMPDDLATLRTRLEERGSDTAEQIERRLRDFDEEVADAPNNDYVVMNHTGRLEETVAELVRIIESERTNPNRPTPRLLDEARAPS